MTRRRRRGFAMLTVLWVMTVASVVALAGAVAGRDAVHAARNRIESERASWVAQACAQRTRATIDSLLAGGGTPEEAAAVWRTLAARVGAALVPSEWPCTVAIEAAGAKLDVNSASDDMIVSALRSLGESDENAASMADALADWRDSDDVARPLGAERDWYVGAGRAPPRNGPLADVKELRLVRGFEDLSRFEALFTTAPGRVALAAAPVAVLSAVPGITTETAERIALRREAGVPVVDLLTVVDSLTPESVAALEEHYSEIARLTTPDPDAWIVTVRATRGVPAVRVELRWRLVRAGRRALVAVTSTIL